MFDELMDIVRRPAPWAEYTSRELWTDPHISAQMLRGHLDPDTDAASRSHAFIDRSAAWVVSHFGLGAGSAVADFGCGPGLYAQRLARAGCRVTGIDFSRRSLDYARRAAAAEGLSVDYVEADYLSFSTDTRFDLVILIYCDFCALSPPQRALLLRTFRSLLAPGGAVLLDAYSPAEFEHHREGTVCDTGLMNGFWASGEYVGCVSTFKYDEQRLVVDKYTIAEPHRTRRVFTWLQCFAPEEMERELAAQGLRLNELWGNVAGSPYDGAAREFAIVARL